jgi:hypothetical protein
MTVEPSSGFMRFLLLDDSGNERTWIRYALPNYTQADAARQTGKLWRRIERLTVDMTNNQNRERRKRSIMWIYVALAGLLLFPLPDATAQGVSRELTARSPRDWAVDASKAEILALQSSNVYLRYRMRIVDQKGEQLRDVIESKDGTVARLMMRDGRPLTAEEDTAERERLNDVLAAPDKYAKHVKNESEGKQLAIKLIEQMPDAMIYSYTPGQPQVGQSDGDGLIVLDYHPNPKWSPPTTIAEAMTGLEGRMWIDAKTHGVRRMEGHLFKAVNFGWGLVAHIYPGGQLLLEQTNVNGKRWMYTHFTQQVSVRALMVKTLNVNRKIDISNFQILPGPMSYQEAIRQLLATPLPTR